MVVRGWFPGGCPPPNNRQKFIMKYVHYEKDHIDPRWQEGRDYQLICGLDEEINFNELPISLNSVKNNRFLPWRVASSEVGAVPVNKGDLCLFLDSDSGEWILEEFLGEWWMDKTKKLCGTYFGGVAVAADASQRLQDWKTKNPIMAKEAAAAGGRKGGKTIAERKKREGKVAIDLTPEQHKERLEKSHNTQIGNRVGIFAKYRCLICGVESNLAGVVRAQKKRGIQPIPENRVRLG